MLSFQTGNVESVCRAFERIGTNAVVLDSRKEWLKPGIDFYVLAGVGHFGWCARQIDISGVAIKLASHLASHEVFLLGICVGLQLLGNGSDESEQPGLGICDFRSCHFRSRPECLGRRVPHVGWNQVTSTVENPVLLGGLSGEEFYFCHSYFLSGASYDSTEGVTDYGFDFPSVVVQKNISGAQFHPEKSHDAGLAFLKNFVSQ